MAKDGIEIMFDCIFCKIVKKQVPSDIIKETEEILVFKDRAPKAIIHYLIIPKKHIKDLSSLECNTVDLGSKIFSMAKELSEESLELKNFRLLINNGGPAGQEVFHLHVHFLAGFL